MKKAEYIYLLLHGIFLVPIAIYLSIEVPSLLFNGGDSYELIVKLILVISILVFLVIQWMGFSFNLRAVKAANSCFGIIGSLLALGFAISNTIGFLDFKGVSIALINCILLITLTYFMYIAVFNLISLKTVKEIRDDTKG